MDHVENPMAGRATRFLTRRRLVISGIAALWMLAGLTLHALTGAQHDAIGAAAVLPLFAVSIAWAARPVR